MWSKSSGSFDEQLTSQELTRQELAGLSLRS